ncbi:hypothetical protein PPERSA_11742 [Pseudocohnilembus persalinus]|uniref:Cytosolic carboxypeptidase-like protein 5 n=1 Tax=Pseudocohnilembus persalinus TaxID=266149 RepID=A0A0V0QGH8_PSEPJ|nr:hypothetical protein PPERSA_11742 [Pseudocohnilembus persalinus]|eukprot:KRX01295.1 hypothetical protein PPERSA_11742 [Pseudocohnilembus persalinus]
MDSNRNSISSDDEGEEEEQQKLLENKQIQHKDNQKQCMPKKSLGHNTYKFYYNNSNGQRQEITFNSDFDSGNLTKVEKINNNYFIMSTGDDNLLTEEYVSTQKYWFFFSVTGIQVIQTVKFQIKKVNSLWATVKSADLYRPVYKVKNQSWKRIENPVVFSKDEYIDVSFDFTFKEEGPIYFAFSYPYTYTECLEYSNQLYQKFKDDTIFYFHKEVLTLSYQKRFLELITISSHEGKQDQLEDKIDPQLFPQVPEQTCKRAHKFRNNKPIIFISGRVHPSESPSSFALKGVLDFLTDKNDARAMFLRKYFVFKIIPMLNPDGVYNGHYRMDTFGQNLNRFYKNPDSEKQSSCYAVRKIAEYWSKDKRLYFYCDFHAHSGKKGCFFYGNALDDFVLQVESLLFAKILSLNCINFEYDDCNFSKKQMTSKDRNEAQTKDGSSRVNLYKIGNLIHSYTLECGFHMSNIIQELASPSQTNKKFTEKNKQYGFVEDEYENVHGEVYRNGAPFYNPQIFQNIGKNILITILDMHQKNPYSRIPNSQYKDIDKIRKEIACQAAKLERFQKKEQKLSLKCKKISTYIHDQHYINFVKSKTMRLPDLNVQQK